MGQKWGAPDPAHGRWYQEVKYVESLSYTEQVEGFSDYSKANNLSFDLYVRVGSLFSKPATLSGPRKKAIDQGDIDLQQIQMIEAPVGRPRGCADCAESGPDLARNGPLRTTVRSGKCLKSLIQTAAFPFYKKNPGHYTRYRLGCGRDARLVELWGKEAGGKK